VLEPAVSVIDVACAALGRDPMASGLRVVDALANVEPLRGPVRCWCCRPTRPRSWRASPTDFRVDDRHGAAPRRTADEVIVELRASELVSFATSTT
jgi:hypothetical protein